MNRIDFLNKINTYAARFVLEVEGFNATNQYHINIHAESFLIPVLNEVFGLNLENLNSTQRKNYPAIDLADFKNRVAFQITAPSNVEKIKGTIEKFFRHELDTAFDVLYVYIITHKNEKYNEEKLQALIPANFTFLSSEHVIDKDAILQKINSISSTPRIQTIAKLYEHEFSDIQIEMRKQKFISGYLNNEPENIFPNLLNISFPKHFYKAELNINEQKLTDSLNDYLIKTGKKPIKKMKPGKLVKSALRENNLKAHDWLLHENSILTFRNLTDSSDPFLKIVDVGTVTQINSKEYYEMSDDAKRVFKNLLRNTLIQFCSLKTIEWFGKKEVFRFANNSKLPNQKKIKWKGKKEATKTVIFEMINKKEGHIICYRNLAFRSSFLNIEDKWFLVINPTWSFTNPGGYHTSRFEPDYMSGIKRLENNKAILNYFRFFGYYLSYTDLFSTNYPYMQIHSTMTLPLSPKLEEKAWKPAKISTKTLAIPLEDIQTDNELFENNLFD